MRFIFFFLEFVTIGLKFKNKILKDIILKIIKTNANKEDFYPNKFILD